MTFSDANLNPSDQLVIAGGDFHTGFDPSTGGFIQVFKKNGSTYEAMVVPISIETAAGTTQGNVTISFDDPTEGGTVTFEGLVVFYTFADDETAITP